MLGISILFILGLFLPILLTLICLMKYKVKFTIVILGLLTFFISQVLIRLPILSAITLYAPNCTTTLAYKILVPLSAGLFEVGADYLAIKYFMKDLSFKNGACLGIAHGLCENLIVLLPVFLSFNLSIPTSAYYISAFERVFALVAHIAFALFAFYAVYKKRISFLILGILLHGISDLPISFTQNIYFIEIFAALIALVSLTGILIVFYKQKLITLQR